MKLVLSSAFIALTACTPSASRSQAVDVNCFRGTVAESDLVQGEMLLNDDDLLKVPIADQNQIGRRSGGSSYFPAALEDVRRYGLENNDGWKWMFAIAAGMFGDNANDALRYFYESAPVKASYFPSTEKLVVFSHLPHVEGFRPYGFWILVRVPADVKIITYDCGVFE